MKQVIGVILFVWIGLVLSAEPNPPTWPSSVYVFDPANSAQNQQVIDSIFATNGGHDPSFNGQWSNLRYALLFMPGTHNVNVNVGYYTSVIGLGETPQDTNIATVTCENGDFDYTGGALSNFWRSAENFYTQPSRTWNNAATPSMMWAVSQACPLRRVYVNGDLNLYEYNSGCCAGYSSGGYLADSVVTGTIYSGSQQQWFTRNTAISSWNGGNWNMVFLGNNGSVPSTHCSNSGGWPMTTIESTPVIAEKPYITLVNGKYSIVVPPVETDKIGPSSFNEGTIIDFSKVYVATSSDSVDTINSKLSSGLHLVLTPGIYNLTGTINVGIANTVVLGIGFPTLVATNGQTAIQITGSEGVRVSGILLQAGPVTTGTLLYWGSNDAGNPSNPGFLYDCFARVGGTNDPSVQQMTVKTMVQIAQGNVVIDNAWLWRADHGVTGEVYNSDNPVYNGLQIFSDNVITYGLAVEHTLQDLVQWFGNNGQVYFYQSELPYDVQQSQFGTPGYVGFRVDTSVTSFEGYGMGVYSYFRDYNVTVESGISTPASGSSIINPLTVFLNGQGEIIHVVNENGNSVSAPGEVSYIC